MNSISGNTEKCLAHLARSIKGRDFYEKRKMVATFVDVADSTVHDWFSENRMPVGEPLIRLRFYLEFLGYDVEELNQLHRVVRDAGRLYAFGIAPLSEVADLVGYTGDNANDSLMKVFRGARNVSPERLQQFSSFVELYGAQLEAKKRAVPKVLQMASSEAHSQRATENHGTSVTTRSASHAIGNQSAVVESFAGLITAMLPLAEYVLSDSFTAAQRTRVRELAGGGKGVSRLSNLFTQLSGEAARTALTNSSKKEAAQ